MKDIATALTLVVDKLRQRYREKRCNSNMLELSLAVMGALVVAVVAYWSFYEPVIYWDDWTQIIYRVARNELQYLDVLSRRPLVNAPVSILASVLGLHVSGYYVALLIINVVSAVILFILLRGLGNVDVIMAWYVCAIYLVYPADYTHMWLTMLSSRVGICLVFAFAVLLWRSTIMGSLPMLVVALACLVLALLIAEYYFGVAMAWGFVVAYMVRSTLRSRIISAATVTMTGVMFFIYRLLNGRLVAKDPLVSELDLHPGTLLSRLYGGAWVQAASWTQVLRRAIGTDSVLSFHNRTDVFLVILLAGLVLFPMLLMAAVFSTFGAATESSVSNSVRSAEMRRAFGMSLIGFILAVAGLVPMIAVVYPNLHGVDSRVNMMVAPGAAMSLVSIIMLIAISIAPSTRAARRLLIAGCTPILFIAIFTQLGVQQASAKSWRIQETIWRGLFTVAPGLVSNTMVVIVMPPDLSCGGFVDWDRLPLTAGYEAQAAIRLFYENDSLLSEVVFPGSNCSPDPLRRVDLSESGVQIETQGESLVVPYSRVVLVQLESRSGDLTMVTDLSPYVTSSNEIKDYEPTSRITGMNLPESQYRHLLLERE